MKILGIMATGIVLSVAAIAPASATAVGCTTYNSNNGTNALPGTDVGTVGSGAGQTCQIGILDPQSGDAASFTVSNYPSIYSFDYDSGELTISEGAYYDGGADAIDILVKLYNLDPGTNGLNTGPMVIAQYTYSVTEGYNASQQLFDLNLKNGSYAIETTFTDDELLNSQNDPKYQVNFVSTQAQITTVPEPWTLAIFGAGLAGAAIRRRRRRAKPV